MNKKMKLNFNNKQKAGNTRRCVRLFLCIVVFAISACSISEERKMKDKHIIKVATIKAKKDYGTNILSFHPEGKVLAASSPVHSKVFIIDVEKRKLIKTLDKGAEKQRSYGLVYSADGKYLIGQRKIAKRTWRFRIWDVENDYVVSSDDMPSGGSRKLYATPDNRVYSYSDLSVRPGTKLFFYTVPDMQLTKYWHDLPGPEKASVSPDGRYMVDSWTDYGKEIGGFDNVANLRIWRYPELELERKILNVDSVVKSFAWTKDSRNFLYAMPSNPYPKKWSKEKREEARRNRRRSTDESVIVFDVSTGAEVNRIGPIGGSPKQIGFLENERYIYALTETKALEIWDRKTNTLIERHLLPKTRWSFDGIQNPVNKNQFIVGESDGILVYEIRGLDESDN